MSSTTNRACRQAGFTLIEIMVVIVILGLLVGVVGPNAWKAIMQSEDQTARATMKSIEGAINMYRMAPGNRGKEPTMEDLITEDDKGQAYLEGGEEPVDPWGQAYKIEQGEGRNKWVVVSAGEDGEFGTEDDLRSDDKREDDE